MRWITATIPTAAAQAAASILSSSTQFAALRSFFSFLFSFPAAITLHRWPATVLKRGLRGQDWESSRLQDGTTKRHVVSKEAIRASGEVSSHLGSVVQSPVQHPLSLSVRYLQELPVPPRRPTPGPKTLAWLLRLP